MSFVLDYQPVSWPVKFFVPADGGQWQEASFNVVFATHTIDEAKKLLEQASDKPEEEYELVKQIVKGWDGVVDAKGNAIPFNQVNLKKLLKKPRMGSLLLEHYWDVQTVEKEKN